MEELLNKLIKKGWKPRNKDYLIRLYVKYGDIQLRRGESYAPTEEKRWAIMSKRELVSKESGLWQFVCENGMVEPYKMNWIKNLEIWSDKMEVELNYGSSDYEAWIIESALKDESELEDFLLQNIKLGNED